MKNSSNQVIYLELVDNVSVGAVKGRGGVPPANMASIPRLERGMTIIVLPDVAKKLLTEKLLPSYEECKVYKSESPEYSRKSQCYDFTGKTIESDDPVQVYIKSIHNKPGSFSLSLLPRIVKVKKPAESKSVMVRLDDKSVWTADSKHYSQLKSAIGKHIIAKPTESARSKRTSDFKFAIQNMAGSDSKNHEVSITLKTESIPKHRLYYSFNELSEMDPKRLKTFLNWPFTSCPSHDWEIQLRDVRDLLEQHESKSRGLRERKTLWISFAILIITALMLVFQEWL